MKTLALMLVLVLAPIASAADDPSFEDLPKRIQNLFNHESERFIRMGDLLWSIQVLKDAERTRDALAPAYELPDAPFIYDPVGEKRYQSADKMIAEHRKALLSELGLQEIVAKVNQVTSDGMLVSIGGKDVMLFGDVPAGVVDDERHKFCVSASGRATYSYTTVMGSVRTVDAYQLAKVPLEIEVETQFVKVSGEELYRYFLEHQIAHFPNWVPRKTIKEHAKSTPEYGQFSGRRKRSTPTVYEYTWQNAEKRVPMHFSWEKSGH